MFGKSPEDDLFAPTGKTMVKGLWGYRGGGKGVVGAGKCAHTHTLPHPHMFVLVCAGMTLPSIFLAVVKQSHTPHTS